MMYDKAKTLPFLLIVSAAAAFAQTPTGTLQGTIADPSQAAVPNAAVTVTNVETNEVKELKADSVGHYIQPFLSPGTYSITAKAQGFRATRQENVKIDVGINRTVDIVLQIGTSVTEVVDVTSAPAALDVNTSAVGNIIENKRVIDLPLNGRNPFALAALSPGVISSSDGEATPHMGGSRNAVSEVQLDGVSIIAPENNVGINVRVYTPPIDAVQEFSVQINNLSAEYGRFGGGVINLVTKSGSNKFHGTGFGFFRNSVLNANDFFANKNGSAKSDTYDDQYGGSIGGPLRKNKTFFFYDFQGEKASGPASFSGSVPIPEWRGGDFSASGTPIYDPYTGHSCTVGTGCPDGFVRDLFPGNKIPGNRIDKVAANSIKYFPAANTGAAGAFVNNFFTSGSTPSLNKQYDARLDHNFSDKWRTSARLSHSWGSSTPLNNFGDPKLIAAEFSNWNGGGPSTYGAYSASLDNTISVSPTLIANVRYGLGRSQVRRTPYSDGFDSTTLGIPAAFASIAQVKEFPRFEIGGNGTSYPEILGNEGWSRLYMMPEVQNVTGNVTKILSRHNIKTGIEVRKLYMNFGQFAYPTGRFGFDNTWTQPNINTYGGGNGVASFLLGLPSWGDHEFDPTPASSSGYWGGYVQDDFKVSSKLTLNLGLRYDLEIPRTERHNELTYFDTSLPSPAAGKVPANACAQCGALKGQIVFVGSSNAKYGRHQVPLQKKDFAPRVGFAWNAKSNWVIRGGFGIAYAPSAFQAAGSSGGAGMDGYQANSNFSTSTDGNRTVMDTLSTMYHAGGPNSINFPLGAAGGGATDLGYNIQTSLFDAVKATYSEQWSFNIQHELPGHITFEVGYLGNRGVHLAWGNNGISYTQLPTSYLSLGAHLQDNVPNPFYGVIPGVGNSQTTQYSNLLRAYPQYGSVSSYRKPMGSSKYHGFTVRADKRYSNGLSFLGAYTAGKVMSDTDSAVGFLGANSGGSTLDSYNLRNEWAVDAQNVSQSFSGSFVYDLPFGKGKALFGGAPRIANAIVGGWQFNGIVTIQTGTPIIMGGGSVTNGIGAGQRLSSTGQSAKLSNPTIDKWFNTSVFVEPQPFTLGNLARTLPDVRNPGISTSDLSLFKNNRFGKEGKYNIQIRTEWFNALNKPQFSGPGTGFGSGNEGVITGTSHSGRQIQMATKFIF